MISQVEHVARAFYDAEDDGNSWDGEPEILKQEFRLYARDAIAQYHQLQQQQAAEAGGSAPVSLSEAA